jgi:uncharacterized protein
MGGFLKGSLAGVAVAAAAFLVIALLVPVEPRPEGREAVPEPAVEAPVGEPAADSPTLPDAPDGASEAADTALDADDAASSEASGTEPATASLPVPAAPDDPEGAAHDSPTSGGTAASQASARGAGAPGAEADERTEPSSDAAVALALPPEPAPPNHAPAEPAAEVAPVAQEADTAPVPPVLELPPAGSGDAADAATPVEQLPDGAVAEEPRPEPVRPPIAPIAPEADASPGESPPDQGDTPPTVAPASAVAATEPEPAEPELAEAAPPTSDDAAVPEAVALAAERGAGAAEPPELTEPALVVQRSREAEMAQPAPEENAVRPAWQRHAAAFQAPDARPLYAVILIDAPADPRAEAALLALTAPVTVALDPADPDAPRRADAYRSAGHEVAIMASRWTDAGALAAQIAALPEAVAWFASPEFWPAGDERMRLTAALADAGLALVVQDEDASDRQGLPRLRAVEAVSPALANRDEVLAILDRTAADTGDRNGEGARVALVGAAAHAELREALMQRAGRQGDAPAAPAPLSAVLAATDR